MLAHVHRRTRQDSDALVRGEGLGHAGARFLLTVPTDLPMRPLRAYAALTSASTVEARVDLVMRELERQRGFDRAYLVIGAPTGGGHLNPVAIELIERLVGGDVASVGIQYGTLPSVLSFAKVDDAREVLDLLIRRIRDRIRAQHPNGGGPRVVLYGESLGGWASQGVLDHASERAGGTDPLRAMGIDTAVWIGIPGFSRFRADRLGPAAMQSLSAISQLDAVVPAARRHARAWTLSHFDDPVHRADLATIWRRPIWLPADGNNPKGVAPHERWRPLLTFLDTVRMVFSTANKEIPGRFTDHGHDYRKELPRLLRAALDLDDTIDDARLARITEQVRQSEVWIADQDWA